MNTQRYPASLSAEIFGKMAEIERSIGKVEGLHLSRPVPKLREKNRARTVRGSTGIEGNRCSMAQVEAIARGETVAVPKTDLLEVKNTLAAYEALPEYNPFSIESLLSAHARLMGGGLMLSPRHFRQSSVEVYITEDKTRVMPDWKTVEPLLQELFDWLRNGSDPMLLKAVLFHFEFVNIHPFLDGNGRTARLWQTRLLMEVHSVFEFLDVESMVFEKRAEYYEKIRHAQECGDAGCFVLFMFEQIERSLSNLWKNSGTVSRDWKNRLETARQQFGDQAFSRKDYLMLFKTIAPVTASRDLASGVEAGQLTRAGDKRTAVYRFV